MNYLVALDYDGVHIDYVKRELCLLAKKHNVQLSLYISSEGHYHIRSHRPLKWEEAVVILIDSACDPSYKRLCLEKRCFPIRTGEKYVHGAEKFVKPKPSHICTITPKNA